MEFWRTCSIPDSASVAVSTASQSYLCSRNSATTSQSPGSSSTWRTVTEPDWYAVICLSGNESPRGNQLWRSERQLGPTLGRDLAVLVIAEADIVTNLASFGVVLFERL